MIPTALLTLHCKPKKAYQALYVWIGKVHRRYKAWPAEFIWLGNFGWDSFEAGQARKKANQARKKANQATKKANQATKKA